MSTIPFRQFDSDDSYYYHFHRHSNKSDFTEAERQLLAHYYRYVRETGDYHFASLVSLAYSTYAVSKATSQQYLLPRKIYTLCLQIDVAVSQLTQHSQNLCIILDNLGNTLSEHPSSVRENRTISNQISNNLLPLHAACETLFDLTQKYGPSKDRWFQRLRHFTNDAELDHIKADVRYHNDSLRYILRYLNTHSHLDTIFLECPHLNWNIYAERLLDYCHDLPMHGENLGRRLQKIICDRAPDYKFSKDIEID